MKYEELIKTYQARKLERKGDYLYFIQSSKTGEIKIGRSKHPQRRLKNLQTGNPHTLRIIASLEGLGWREKELHEELKRWRKSGEWFSYECVGSIPVEIYDLIPFGGFDDWWEKS